MARAVSLFCFAVCWASSIGSAVSAQEVPGEPSHGDEPLRVFLDCDDYICDFDYFRREVDFISYVRDRMDAELHVLVTSQPPSPGRISATP